MNEIKIYELPNYAYQKYIKSTKKNRNASHDEVRRKLTRSIMLGITVYEDKVYNQRIVLYGHLKIRINTTIDGREMITGIWNYCKPDPYWMLHLKNYRKISKKLGLEIKR